MSNTHDTNASPFAKMSARGMAAAILRDPCASQWLKQAVTASMNRDVCDALGEAEVLVELLTKSYNDTTHGVM